MTDNQKVIVLQIKGWTDEDIQSEFTEFLSSMAEKYGDKFGVKLTQMTKKGALGVLRIVED